jgi:hypothetical protein
MTTTATAADARSIDVAAIRDRANAASPAPWFWRGNVDTRQIYLAHNGRVGWTSVMSFARWGMQSARPRFLRRDGIFMADAEDYAVYEVCRDALSRADRRVYRGDIVGFRHPDAEFLAGARQDVDDLLAILDQVAAICTDAEDNASGFGQQSPTWVEEIRAALRGVA